MDVTSLWRGTFTSAELNALHAEAFGTEVFEDDEWDRARLVAAHSLGWVAARDAQGLVGFVNVLWDGLTHAWLQDVMVARRLRHRGVGRAVVDVAVANARAAGCEWLHVDFTPDLAPFYLSACGFEPARAGLLRL